MTISSLSTGRFTAGQEDAVLRPFDRMSRNPVVWCHGLSGDASWGLGDATPSQIIPLERLTDYGFTVVMPSTGNTWGNATGRARVADAVTWSRANGASSQGVVRLGTSHGATTTLQSAAANPGDTACIVLMEPALDLVWLRATDVVEGNALRASIDAAWGVTYPAALPAGASPLELASALAGIPIQLWYATDDDISHNFQAFADAHGNTTTLPLGALGHSDAAVEAVNDTVLANFVNTHA